MPKINVNGVELYYELHGRSEEVVVLNNGVIASTATWFWNFSEAFFARQYDLLVSRIEAAKALDLPSVIQLCRCFNTLDVTGRLAEIERPTCVLVGEADILKSVHYSRTIVEAIPNSELHILPGAGHASFWEKAAEFNTVLLGFLQKQQRMEK